jgi:hypothetical protein
MSELFSPAVDLSSVEAGTLNDLAWRVAIDPRSERETLLGAQAAAQRAVKERPSPARLDTLAAVDHRLGLDALATSIECDAVHRERRPKWRNEYLSELARFLRASWVPAEKAGPGAILELTANTLRLTAEPKVDAGLSAVAFAEQDGQQFAVELRIGSGALSNGEVLMTSTIAAPPSGRLLPLGCLSWDPKLTGAPQAIVVPFPAFVARLP